MKTLKGTDLSLEDQKYVLSAYVHRYTKEHVPNWVKNSDREYKVQFRSDQEWLENTYFAVTKSGKLDKRSKSCQSNPTFPEGSEIRI